MPKKPAAAPQPKTSTRGRKPLQPLAEQYRGELDQEKLAERRQELVAMGQHEAEVAANAQALAQTIGYQGDLSAASLVDGIRFYQHRTAEAALEIGKRLLLLKETTAHGEFHGHCEGLGLHARMAQRFMVAALKFSNATSKSLLQKVDLSQTKMLELVVLDDEDLEALSDGKSVNGLILDDIETMSASELRKALRESRQDVEDKDARAKTLTEQVEKAEEKAAKAARSWKKATPDEQLAKLLQEAQAAASQVRLAIAQGSEEAGLAGALYALIQHAEANGQNVGDQAAGIVASLINELRLVRDGESLCLPVVQDKPYAFWLKEADAK